MSDGRRHKIQAMLEASPEDQTLRYMLAMECDKAGDHEDSLRLFGELMEHAPPYVPAFLMAGQLLARLDRIAEAKATYAAGVIEANKQGNDHAAGEMAAFSDTLPDDDS
ncbi:MAG: hypothetical protein ABJZ55_03270 [Fuerstiella sp.]